MRAQERIVLANGLRHRVLEWDGGGRSTLLLLHGFLDHARTWEDLVDRLPPSWHIVAFDWRGHGDTESIGAGGYYHFSDYLFDLADLADQVCRDGLALCGHSMGGVVASLYAGTFPERVSRLAMIEGLGPRAARPAEAPGRAARWIAQVRAVRGRERPPLPSLEEAARRILARNPRLSEERALRLARAGTRPVAGGFRWAFDPLHQTRAPSPFLVELVAEFWKRVTCPVAMIHGAEGEPPADAAEREAHFRTVELRRVIPGAGHMVQLDAPDELARLLSAFFEPVL